jgi:hypothetical protein
VIVRCHSGLILDASKSVNILVLIGTNFVSCVVQVFGRQHDEHSTHSGARRPKTCIQADLPLNTETGSPPSLGSESMMAGILLFRRMRRKSGLNWSPALILTG